jgi:y4mF family transcriptional regulator
MTQNKLSLFVKQERKKLGLSQVQCAIYAGVGLAFLRSLEQGKTSLKMDNVNKVLRLFGAELGPVKVQDK